MGHVWPAGIELVVGGVGVVGVGPLVQFLV
jgi:hypothetical protein